jgi:hypothetical protein
MKLGIILIALGSFLAGAYVTGIFIGIIVGDPMLPVGQTLGLVIICGPLFFFGIRRIRDTLPEQKLTEKQVKQLQEILSCPTCAFFDLESMTEEPYSWCDAPNPPNVEKNYCHTFIAKQDSPAILPR